MPQKSRIGRNPLKTFELVTPVEAEETVSPVKEGAHETSETTGNLRLSLNEFLKSRDKENFKKLLKIGFIEVGSEAYLLAQKVSLWTKDLNKS